MGDSFSIFNSDRSRFLIYSTTSCPSVHCLMSSHSIAITTIVGWVLGLRVLRCEVVLG